MQLCVLFQISVPWIEENGLKLNDAKNMSQLHNDAIWEKILCNETKVTNTHMYNIE